MLPIPKEAVLWLIPQKQKTALEQFPPCPPSRKCLKDTNCNTIRSASKAPLYFQAIKEMHSRATATPLHARSKTLCEKTDFPTYHPTIYAIPVPPYY